MSLWPIRRHRHSRPAALPPTHANRGGVWGIAPVASYLPATKSERWIAWAVALLLLATVVTVIIVLVTFSV
jgi:hypothetical protein